MKYLTYIFKRYWFTAQSKAAAVIATKIHKVWTFDFLMYSLRKRDETIVRESKYCLQRVCIWQNHAKACIIAHHDYEKEMEKVHKAEKKEA